MSDETYSYLIFKKLREGLDPGETHALEQWLAQSPENQRAAAEIEAIFRASEIVAPPADTKSELARLKNRLRAEAAPADVRATYRRPHIARWAWAAAAAVALLLCAIFFFKNQGKPAVEIAVISAKSSKIEQLALPDGSLVALREGAEIRFPKNFGSTGERRVQLTGEAFFEVQKNVEHPFVVEAGGCATRVLGTQFNIRARADEPSAEISVREGRVQVSGKNGSQVVLNAGQQAVFDKKTSEIKILGIEAEAVADWRSTDILFQKTALREAAQRLSRRFGQKIEIENTGLADGCQYSAYFPQAELDKILQNMESVFGLRAERTPDGGYILRGGRCPN